WELLVGRANSVMTPPGVIRATLSNSVNQRFPSPPTVSLTGLLVVGGKTNSTMLPLVVILPILLAITSVNHMFPSGPPVGAGDDVERETGASAGGRQWKLGDGSGRRDPPDLVGALGEPDVPVRTLADPLGARAGYQELGEPRGGRRGERR